MLDMLRNPDHPSRLRVGFSRRRIRFVALAVVVSSAYYAVLLWMVFRALTVLLSWF